MLASPYVKTLPYLNTQTKERSRRRSRSSFCCYARSSSLNSSDRNRTRIGGQGMVGAELGFHESQWPWK